MLDNADNLEYNNTSVKEISFTDCRFGGISRRRFYG